MPSLSALRSSASWPSLARPISSKVGADGTLIADGAHGPIRGSIPQVGAHAQGAPACNGWAFWFFEADGAWIPIERLRQQVRAELH